MTVLLIILGGIVLIGFFVFIFRNRGWEQTPDQIEQIQPLGNQPDKGTIFSFEVRKGLYMNLCKQKDLTDNDVLNHELDALLRCDTFADRNNEFTPFCQAILAGDLDHTCFLGANEDRKVLKEKILSLIHTAKTSKTAIYYARLRSEKPISLRLTREEKNQIFTQVNRCMRRKSQYHILASVAHSDNVKRSYRIGMILTKEY